MPDSRLVQAATIAGAFAYAVVRVSLARFYGRFGVDPEEVGLGYASCTYFSTYISLRREEPVTTVGIRELARRASAIVRGVRETGEPAIVTDRGRPVGVLYPIDADALEDYVLANAPEFVTSLREADEDLAAGRTVSLDELLATSSRG